MSPRVAAPMALALALALASGALGCGRPQTQGDTVAANVKKMGEDRTPEKLFAQGKAFHQMGDLVRAEQYYAAALQAGAPEKEVLPLLLRACVQGKRYRVAIEYAEPVLKRHPDDFRLRTLVASLHQASGEPQRARVQLEIVLASHPDEAVPHYALAVLLRDDFHDLVGADAHFREYLRIEPKGSHADEARASLLKSVP